MTEQDTPQGPRPIRNEIARPGEEVLVLRHQKLSKGMHQRFYEISRDGVWPWYEKIGTRMVGQWQIVYPDGGEEPEDYDEGYRLARYRSYEHWEATRTPVNIHLGGDGQDFEKNKEALGARREYLIGSDGPFFLQGRMAPGGPFYMPGVMETFEGVEGDGADQGTASQQVELDDGDARPVRNGAAVPGQELVTLRYWKVKKGCYDDFYQASQEGVWPYFNKIGARPVGQWKVIYPPPPACDRKEHADYDEILMMTRYASYAHWEATRRAVELGGNGPDYGKMREAMALRRSLSQETWVQFLQGYMYDSPPVYLPGLEERYRLV